MTRQIAAKWETIIQATVSPYAAATVPRRVGTEKIHEHRASWRYKTFLDSRIFLVSADFGRFFLCVLWGKPTGRDIYRGSGQAGGGRWLCLAGWRGGAARWFQRRQTIRNRYKHYTICPSSLDPFFTMLCRIIPTDSVPENANFCLQCPVQEVVDR